ncbi:hypothetical protein BBK36DRAFT_1108252 [Trichoderma citrinoviride]|uniref:Formylmethionine deformylase-like protein n=1 Tax=Trichoderma citrinoviride TaxID=58853 RepID=A0A2T4BNQ2_9HYPO|nr:hypothetical protein BBK36DRAFT_1108252 [Trichoderma citrinoviride]PTB70916.1 hypothetical protein BBK36DRAFT_1108252 [Trichoderma citrinoviride]
MALFKAHWAVPSLMISGLLCGVAFALGHHFFYASLDSRIVQSNTEQEWNIRIGTGMAFLVKTCLTAAAGFAYTQLLWTTLRSRHATLEGVDAMFSVTTSAWEFLSVELWRKGFGLVLMAGILWALPIIAVFTPAALTVQPSQQLNRSTHIERLPTINTTSPYPFAQWGNEGGGGYVAPSVAVARLVSSVASQGTILPIQAPHLNSSYALSFYGPSLSCGPLGGNSSFHAAYDKTFTEAYGSNWGMANQAVTYFSFVPQTARDNKTGDDIINWENRTLSGLRAIFGGEDLTGTLATLDNAAMGGDTQARCRFFVAFPTYGTFANRTIECGLYNSSYHVDLRFENGRQAIKIRNSTRLNPVSGATTAGQGDHILPQVAYISIMDALGGTLMGKIMATRYGSLQPVRTQVLSTVLTQAHDMQYLQRGFGDTGILGAKSGSGTNLSMAKTLEQLVSNITLSLFSSPELLRSLDNSTTGNVTVWTSQNEYSYNPRNLYAAYGTGIFATLVVVIVGLACIGASSNSYKSSFSTILRTTRSEELDLLVPHAETSGAEPLSKHLAKTKLSFRHHNAAPGANASSTSAAAAGFVVVKGGRPAYEQLGQIQDDSTLQVTETVSSRDLRTPGRQE